ncbi:MAG: phosphatase PAP2 family protein [Myxococcota bacterium]|nr:phosphatase PAP2 family protein [Myxococcota bacterium]MDW8362009.1 phosphatase PAP2 family protein [Myxococcales bacterium]
MRVLLFALVFASCTWTPARAQTDAPPRLRVDLPLEGSLTAGAVVLLALSETLFKDALSPDACRWCEPPGFDAAVRDALHWERTRPAEIASAVTGFVLAPVAAYGGLALAAHNADRLALWPHDALIVTESVALTMFVTAAVKGLVGRRRPIAHFRGGGLEIGSAQEANLSFFSGHSSLSFSLATASATVASLRGDRAAPWLWAGGLLNATLTGWLRIAADAHYLSDVLTGALVGTLLGVGLPWLRVRLE